jgi:hypothetical protein
MEIEPGITTENLTIIVNAGIKMWYVWIPTIIVFALTFYYEKRENI